MALIFSAARVRFTYSDLRLLVPDRPRRGVAPKRKQSDSANASYSPRQVESLVEAWLESARAAGFSEEAILRCDKAIALCRKSATSANVRRLLAVAINFKAVALDSLLRLEDAKLVNRELIKQFESERSDVLVEIVSHAIFRLAEALDLEGHTAEAMLNYDRLISRFELLPNSMHPAIAAGALFNKAFNLKKKPKEAIQVYDHLIAFFGRGYSDNLVQRYVAAAFLNKGALSGPLQKPSDREALWEFGAYELDERTKATIRSAERKKAAAGDAISIYSELISRFEDSSDLEILRIVGQGLHNLASCQEMQDRFGEAVVVYNTIINKFGESQDTEMQQLHAAAFVGKFSALIGSGRQINIGLLDEVIDKYGRSDSLDVQRVIVEAFEKKIDLFSCEQQSANEDSAFKDFISWASSIGCSTSAEIIEGAISNYSYSLGMEADLERAAVAFASLTAGYLTASRLQFDKLIHVFKTGLIKGLQSSLPEYHSFLSTKTSSNKLYLLEPFDGESMGDYGKTLDDKLKSALDRVELRFGRKAVRTEYARRVLADGDSTLPLGMETAEPRPRRLDEAELSEFKAYAEAHPWHENSGVAPSTHILKHFKNWFERGLSIDDIRAAQDDLASAYKDEVVRNTRKRIAALSQPHKLPAGTPRLTSRKLAADLSEEEKKRKQERNRIDQRNSRKRRRNMLTPK